MEDQIVAKLRSELERGITTECQVVYVLVEIRKLLDRDTKNAPPYNSLRLYSNWVVHVELTGLQAQNVVKRADAFYPKIMAGTLNEEEKGDFARIFSLDVFREELNHFLEHKNLTSFSDSAWNIFLACFLNVIEDCQLACRAKDETLSHVDEVVVLRHGRTQDGSPQSVIWALCLKGKFKMSVGGIEELSDEIIAAIEAFSEVRNG